MNRLELSDLPLTLLDVVRVARGGADVTVSAPISERLRDAREALLRLAASSQSIYGLTSALGANTGSKLASDEEDDIVGQLAEYQVNAIRARSVGVGKAFPTDVVRAMLLARIAGMRVGGSGISPPVFEALVAMLNAHVHPVVPHIGSISVGDLAPLSALALPLIGEGLAEFRGTVMPGAEALKAAGIAPPELGPKDGLSLISSNAATVGVASLLLTDVAAALDALDYAAALSCEGFRANLSPLDPRMQQARPAPGQSESAARIGALLEGSALWQPGAARRVQDPLSFRCIAQVHGTARSTWNEARAQVELELNSAADSPLLLDSGEMLSNGNFHIPSLGVALEALGLALTQCAALSVERSHKLQTPAFTELPLQLTRHGPAHSGFATVQKTLTALWSSIRHAANPGSLDFFAVSEGAEDHATMAYFVAEKLVMAIGQARYLVAIELLVAAQAVDLRGLDRGALGAGARAAYDCVRAAVPVLDGDRSLGPDIEHVAALLRSDALPRP